MKSIFTLLSRSSKARTSHFKLFGAVFAFTGLVLLLLPSTVLAGGGVGGGGSGGGGGGGHQTSYGWGWSIYQTSGAGPTDGFRNGGSWASAKSTCQGANASQVYAFIVYNSSSDGMIYDYQSSWDSFRGHFADGTSLDHGKATAISTAQAKNAYDSLPSYGVSTSGYTWGSNVGWFCYNFAPPPPTTSTVQIHVFKTRTDNTGTYTNVGGATTAGNCGNSASAMTTGANGFASRDMNDGAGLCLRLTNAKPAVAQYQTIDGPYIRPWGEGYGSGCGNYAGSSNYAAHCASGSYECQRVGVKDPNTCGGVDRASDGGFDFVYVITPAPTPSCSISANPNPMNEGENTTISWSSSYGSSMTVTGNGRSWSGTSGSRSDNPTRTVTYTGNVSNADGSASCSTTVTVIPLPRCTISVNPSSYVGGGANYTTVTWSSSNATNVTVNRGSTYFASGTSGSQTDNQQAPNTYNYNGTATIIGARNITLSTTCSANLLVYPPPGCSSSPAYPAPNDTVTFTATGGDPGKPYTWSTGYTGNPMNTTYASAGVYSVTVTNGGVSASCTTTIVNKPYHRVFGGDTLAGVGFAAPDSTCPAASVVNGKRQIGFNRNMGGGYTGGGNSHANIATGAIVDFVSGMLEGPPYGPRTFAISNTSGGYGGNLSTGHLTTACANNYYSKLPAGASGLGSPTNVPTSDGDYAYTGNMTLNGGTVPAGVRVTIYVSGNVFIGGNITYANSGGYGTDPTQVPSFRLVVLGNIYVSANVSELNGIYIAQPNGASGGAFYTCGFDRGGGNFTGPSGAGNPYTSSEFTNTCATNQLTVYGAVVAQDVRLHRTRNTLPTAPEAFPGASAAERFIYTPDVWFNGDPSTSKPFQAYTALPSIF